MHLSFNLLQLEVEIREVVNFSEQRSGNFQNKTFSASMEGVEKGEAVSDILSCGNLWETHMLYPSEKEEVQG